MITNASLPEAVVLQEIATYLWLESLNDNTTLRDLILKLDRYGQIDYKTGNPIQWLNSNFPASILNYTQEQKEYLITKLCGHPLISRKQAEHLVRTW